MAARANGVPGGGATAEASSRSARRQRQQWAGLVEQLADDRFARAEGRRPPTPRRRQRRAGLSRATRLQPTRSGATVSHPPHRQVLGQQRSDDAPEQAARLLADDPSVWLALLARDDVAIRRAAAQWLALLLGGPVGVDPAAEPASQKNARDALRARIEKKAAGGAKPQAAP